MASLRKLGIDQVRLEGKKVLIRIDLNVEMRNGHVTNWRRSPHLRYSVFHRTHISCRLVEGVPTIKYVLEKGAAVILISHIGRPNGRFVPHLSLRPFASKLAKRLHRPVEFLPDCVGRYSP
jgi:phosphoglycerate kinase